MLRQVKPRNARSKRALEKREPKANENPKTCLFLRGTTCSQIIQDALNDLHQMRQPLAKKFTKKNAIHPFDDAASLEFFSEKNDASLLVFGSSQKKRPHTLTFVRTFGYKVLDMLELYLDPESFRSIAQFKTKKFAIGLRPMILFAGTAFESPVSNEFTLAKSMLLDFFKGEPSDKIDVEGLQYIISISAEDSTGDGDVKPAIHLRVYTINTKRSGQRLPRVEVEEIGPRMDFRVGRVREPDESMLKEAMKKPRGTEERTKKNITTDSMGDKIGRVHLGKQDLSELQLRKMKGLKRSRKDAEDAVDVVEEEDSKRIKQ
ncbi:valyl-tRNA synthetase [Fusarium oxysporum f. sp. lycopersici 4287]|uniref:Ribosome production factor 2 homolog n=3 Tax=Fusarium oxysporum TaxID=5507 RepID=A0A0J9WFV2_FUSO4|nr:valyl-tRNA synthetase [Fusarium oxysporum f. sp. lycopersici 4287]EXK47527.1 valyl-tRNA synthetase [Fusarium oxysporum f. sp. melonis 26406]KAJ9429093.1 valyl-tRNA synthetase [Fusarium oxysporum]KNA93926.1 valyl-tRNA synthetase [Fusarium oxysporum f. sp. lycopersici 4287]